MLFWHDGMINGLAFTNDGKQIVVGGEGDFLTFYDAISGKVANQIKVGESVGAIAAVPNTDALLICQYRIIPVDTPGFSGNSGTVKYTILLVNTKSGVVKEFEDPGLPPGKKMVLSVSSDGKTLAYVTWTKPSIMARESLNLEPHGPSPLLARTCALAGRRDGFLIIGGGLGGDGSDGMIGSIPTQGFISILHRANDRWSKPFKVADEAGVNYLAYTGNGGLVAACTGKTNGVHVLKLTQSEDAK